METSSTKYELSRRKYLIISSLVVIFFLFTIRLFFLQVADNEYKEKAENNAFLRKTLYPARGVIYDRKERLLVYNQPAYDVMMIMREVEPFDTLDFCKTLGITKEVFDQRILDIKDKRLNPGYSSYVPQIFMTQLSTYDYGVLQEKLYKFPGFYIQNRTIREYSYPNAALLLGNIGEVNQRDIEKDNYYVRRDYSGRAGVEKSYEHVLRGEKGVEVLLRDVHGRIKGQFEEEQNVAPKSGKNLTLSIDIDLQAYAEKLMVNKKGSIVMIEPSTGEILCMVSSPSYDPNLLVGRQRGINHSKLEQDPQKPFLDRSIMGTYSPGSTFKVAQGLVFLQEGVITPQKMYTCAHGYTFRGGKPACHGHGSPLDLLYAISTSCNSYFCWGLHDMLDSRRFHPNITIQQAFEIWKDHIVSMGFGYQLGVDLPSEKRGYIPNSKVYDKIYNGRWNSSTIISIAIGQGEITATPLQICNLAATIANRGYYVVPHVVKKIEDTPLDSQYVQRKYTTIDSKHYTPIAQGMRDAVVKGTCWRLNMKDIEVCGKTGTVENPHGRDHASCIAFAPYNNPEVSIVVYVENGGFGGTGATPIARLMFEQFFYGEIQPESKSIEQTVLNTVINVQ